MKPDASKNMLMAMLLKAAKEMGTTPEALMAAARTGQLSETLESAGAAGNPQLLAALRDPEAAKRLLSTPEAQALLRGLGMGPQKG